MCVYISSWMLPFIGGLCTSLSVCHQWMYICNNIAKARTTLDRKSWSLSFFVSPFLTKLFYVYESIFNWLSLAAAATAATTTFTAAISRITLFSFFFDIFHSETNRKFKFNLLERVMKALAKTRSQNSKPNEWKERNPRKKRMWERKRNEGEEKKETKD